MKQTNQRGFGAIEAIVIAVIFLALAGVGYWVMQRSDNNSDSSSDAAESIEAPTAPEITTAEDLQSVEETLRNLDLNAGNSDNVALDEQANQLD